MRFDLQLLCAAKVFYQLIALVLEQLNSISDNEYIKIFSFVRIELKVYLIIENDLKFNKRMNDVFIYILC